MILGFITRNCKDFTDPVALNTLFTSSEYNSVVWPPHIKYQIHSLDNIQNHFLRFFEPSNVILLVSFILLTSHYTICLLLLVYNKEEK